MKRIVCFLLTIILCLSLEACGRDWDESLCGNYNLYAVDYHGAAIESEGIDNLEAIHLSLSRRGLGNLTAGNESIPLTWTSQGNELTLTGADQAVRFSVTEDGLTLPYEGLTLHFLKNTFSASQPSLSKRDVLNGDLDELLYPLSEEDDPDLQSRAELERLRRYWLGNWYGSMELSDCGGTYAFLEGSKFDAVLSAQIGNDGKGQLSFYEPAGMLTAEEDHHLFAALEVHADGGHLMVDSGELFGQPVRTEDWHFLEDFDPSDPVNKIESSFSSGENAFDCVFLLMPWGYESLPEAAYLKELPGYSDYVNAIKKDAVEGSGPDQFTDTLDYRNLGEICLSYPGENWKIKEEYSLIKHKDSGTVIRLIPYYNPKNFEEYRSLLKENFEDSDSFTLQETDFNGFRALCCRYSDILGCHLEVIIDFGIQLEASSAFGLRLSISGDSPEACINEEVLSIIRTLSPSVPASPLRFSEE